MADGSLDTEDVRVIELKDRTKMFEFREYIFPQLPLRFICIDDEYTMVHASTCSVGALIVITGERVAGLCTYCESLTALC